MGNGHVINLKGNVVRVDFRREPDPPAPKFPGANGLRPLKEGEREPECIPIDWTGKCRLYTTRLERQFAVA